MNKLEQIMYKFLSKSTR